MLLFIPFLALDDKGGVKGHLCTHLGMCRPCIPLFRTHVVLFLFQTLLIVCKDYVVWEPCNVCYSVFSYRTWVYSKKILLVCVLFELTDCCFFCVLAQKGRILRDTGRILRIPYPESPDLYPESPGPANRYTFYWVDNMSYASHLFLHSLVHPTVKHIRAFVVLLIYMPRLLTWQVKFEIQSSWHTLRGSSYMLDVYRFMIIKWVTCGLSSITKKGEIESDLGP